ncbi:hypothetical protein IGI04_037244 [Brassica rapa subsp. trilocularis]|uniref:Uncharacterized protein n=1 Tax=Brassica rapa subsp. trilocularis TaxID=1813537 RepID=A0ABQ7LGU0_BRACM|nr:hypothetical protein IGI04_037244 [Brassica rapa subsp. trilocularis]
MAMKSTAKSQFSTGNLQSPVYFKGYGGNDRNRDLEGDTRNRWWPRKKRLFGGHGGGGGELGGGVRYEGGHYQPKCEGAFAAAIVFCCDNLRILSTISP